MKSAKFCPAACFIAMLALAAFLGACSSGKHLVPPTPSDFVFSSSGDAGRVYAPAGSVDAGTTARLTSGGTGQGTVGADGSVAFDATWDASSAVLEYVKSGQTLTNTFSVQTLASRVTKPLFSTGSAPNDMELVDGALVVANSLDNSVVRYALDGAVQSTASFPQFASPSYLALDDPLGMIFVARNGDNLISGHKLPDLTLFDDQQFQLTDAATAAFIGPGKPAINGSFMYVPRTEILSFGPTVYGDGLLTVFDTSGVEAPRDVATSGRNVVFALVTGEKAVGPQLYVVSAGELQFDADFNPSIATDGYLDIYSIQDDGEPKLTRSINLGRVGASSLAVVHDATQYRAYLGNLLSGDAYVLDLNEASPAPAAIHLTDEFTYISDVELIVNTSLLLATSFNTDELYVIDTATDTVSPGAYPAPFDLSLDPDLLAGCSNVEVDTSADHPVAYVLYGVANAVAKVDLF